MAGCGGSKPASHASPPRAQYPKAFKVGFLRTCKPRLRQAGLPVAMCGCLLARGEQRFTLVEFEHAFQALRDPTDLEHARVVALFDACAAASGVTTT
jgi:hypothetical protein